MIAPIVCGVRVRSLFCFTVLCALSSFAIILLRKIELVALLLAGRSVVSDCGVAITVPCLLLAISWVGLWSVTVAASDLCLFLMLPWAILYHVIVTSSGPTRLHFGKLIIGQYIYIRLRENFKRCLGEDAKEEEHLNTSLSLAPIPIYEKIQCMSFLYPATL